MIDGLPGATGAYHVIWFECEGDVKTPIDSAWLSRGEFAELMLQWDAQGFAYEATYDKHALLDSFDKVARVVKEL